jgi:hypothetical protein
VVVYVYLVAIYLMMLVKAELVKYLENSRSVAAFLARVESSDTAFFKFSVSIEVLLVLAPSTELK